MPAITSGAELVRKLKESGTGEAKLLVARGVLVARGAKATAGDVLEALALQFPGSLTVAKAKSLAAIGEWNPEDAKPAPTIEDELLAEKPARTTGSGIDRPGIGPVVKEDAKPTAGKK